MKGIKFAVVFAFLLSAGSLTGSWYLFQQYQMERAAREDLESQIVQLEERNASQESQLKLNREELERLNAQIEDETKKSRSLQEKLTQAEEEAGGLRERVSELEEENKNLARPAVLTPPAETEAVEENEELPKLPPPPVLSPAPMPVAKPVALPAAAKPKDVSPAVPVATPAPAAPAVDERPKQVLSVNRKFNFAVVNFGSRDKLQVGSLLQVEQNGKPVGRLQVEKLYENFSACTILEETKPSSIKEGDLVRLA
ncbi:MAG: hypothetical protein HYU34_05060 [Candidatus Omnitrophica bacterium]|nr:hypothetical protein [Candidatus Omnitrophota bacterium]